MNENDVNENDRGEAQGPEFVPPASNPGSEASPAGGDGLVRSHAPRRWVWLVLAALVLTLTAAALIVRSQQDPSSVETPSTSPTASVGATGPTTTASSGTPTTSPAPSSSRPAPSGPSATTRLPTPPKASGALPEMPPVDVTADSDRAGGVVVSLPLIESVAGQAQLPGEVAGAAIRVTIRVQNDSNAAVGLDAVVVNAYAGASRAPLESLTSPGGRPFGGSVKPGAEATAVYLFAVDPSDRSDVTITVDLQAGTPASVFRGDVRQ
ncbi:MULTISPECIES: hypothetical protein [Aestuariimicrobium]|uniref:hypothetical protein n=1 Tax=Aestuariimicrobium TaxID=396388 RepID=UPI0003B37514|nr:MULTISPECIES: hypothetical protein [Aestuariimicrobium]